jgi:hypothetical protein
LRQNNKTLAYEAKLSEKTHEQLLKTHQANMDELDAINKRLLETLNKKEKDEEDDFDVEREEQPLEERKFSNINDSLSPIPEASELVTEQQMSFAGEHEAPKVSNDFMMTMKTDVQRATMATEMRQMRPAGTAAVFNPFKSKSEEEEGQNAFSPRSEDNSIARD